MTFTLRFVRLKLFMYIENHFKLQTIKFHSNVKSQITKIHLKTCKTIKLHLMFYLVVIFTI